jgi:hypothetical protein
VQLVRAVPGPSASATDGDDRVQQGHQELTVVGVGG